MDPIAVERAYARLEKAENAIKSFDLATCYADAECHWWDFLTALSSIYNQLEQGSKGNLKSENWFGRVKGARKKSPLLRYLKCARNSDEHGIEYVTARTPCGGFNLPYGERHEFVIQPFNPVTGVHEGDSVRAWGYGPHLKLIRVHDRRDHTYCDPPYATVEPPGDPSSAGHEGIRNLRLLVEEANTLI